MRNLKMFGTLLCLMFVMCLAGSPAPADAGFTSFPIWKTYFPPFKGTGTIIQIGDLSRDSGGELCTVFLADSDGGLYFFNGVDSYAVGTRLKVTGNTCTICLSTLTCGIPVSPILNAVATEI